MTKDEALKLALEALESMSGTILELGEQTTFNEDQAITAIKEALAQPAQEPDGFIKFKATADKLFGWVVGLGGYEDALRDLYGSAAPPQRPWVKLTDDEIQECWDTPLTPYVYLTAGGSPEIRFDDGSHGTYMLREFAELFGYTTPPEALAQPAQPAQEPMAKPTPEPTPEELEKIMLEVWQPVQPAQEPDGFIKFKATADKLFGWVVGLGGYEDALRDLYGSAAPPQRPWVGLTDDEIQECWDTPLTPYGMQHAKEMVAKLKEKNS